MNHLMEAVSVLLDPDAWSGPSGFGARMLEHLWYTGLALLISAALALPVGLLVGHTGRWRALAVISSGMVRALPTLGVITLAALFVGIGLTAPMIAFVVLAIPSILAGAYAGVESVNPATKDAATAQGMSGWQVLLRVEIPLGLPLIIGGLRNATLQVVATATLAAYVGAGGLGRQLFLGLRTQDYPLMLAASLAVILLAIVLDALFELSQRLLRRRMGVV
ncbi:ABC transporter permease [Nesterenkonia sphaerica]|uniref:ABC transporter permease n=1 Tax=Nesterenkonia sphaerica TaxID=1804988 RepID=A0A5R9AJB3_9MICC|nr:ABC transporter permease [Nesterenkonia sphaerica]TLP78852.1 ABC transporter permease [Nesterenkonia sphaerica]